MSQKLHKEEIAREQGDVLSSVLFSDSNIFDYLTTYLDTLQKALLKIDGEQLKQAHEIIGKCAEMGNTVFVCGNGGSSAIADHLCCDFTKGTYLKGCPTIKTQSLSSNVAMFSACANDYGYAHSFSSQIKFLGKPGDTLIAISSSGKSENILNAIAEAKAKEIRTIGLSGFMGGAMITECDVNLHVPISNYGIAEDAHQILMHVLAQFQTKSRMGS